LACTMHSDTAVEHVSVSVVGRAEQRQRAELNGTRSRILGLIARRLQVQTLPPLRQKPLTVLHLSRVSLCLDREETVEERAKGAHHERGDRATVTKLPSDWEGVSEKLPVHDFTCGECGRFVASHVGWKTSGDASYVLVCPKCRWPSVFVWTARLTTTRTRIYEQYPRPRIGDELKHLTPEVEDLWNQIRDAQVAGAPALAVMGCRTMLIHLGEDASKRDVASGEVKGEPKRFGKFTTAVKYLKDSNWLPKGAQKVGDMIRKAGDSANHKLGALPDSDQAAETISFTESILRNMYEVPGAHGAPVDTDPTAKESSGSGDGGAKDLG